MNKNCPYLRINLEAGFPNIIYMKMAWHKMMHLMHSIASNEIKHKTTLPAIYGHRNHDDRNTRSQVQHVRGLRAKIHHHQCPFNKMNSTIIFLTFFFPKT